MDDLTLLLLPAFFTAVIHLAFSLVGIAGIYVIIRSVIWGAPFVPTKNETMANMLELLDVRPGEKAADLGSGDGKIVIALAQRGAEAHGYETNPFLVWWSRRRIQKAGAQDRAFVHRQNLWKADCSKFSAVAVFGISYIMPQLERKLRRELPAGARVVSNAFRFPNWPDTRSTDRIFLYTKE